MTKNRLKGEVTGIAMLGAAGVALIAAALMPWASSCAPLPTTPSADNAPLNPPNESTGASVSKGWLPEYSKFIEQSVSPALLAYPPESVCPKYRSLSDAGKRRFWSSWFESIAYPESGFDRADRYKEPGMRDSQGRQVWSEGLTQLSEQDADKYKTPACQKIKDDKTYAPTDPARPIFSPYYNLACAMEISARLVQLHPSELFESALGRYWSTVRDGKVRAYFNAHFPSLCK